jgi:amino acid adenylation domain-containing protein
MPGNPIVQRLMDLSADDLRRELFASATGRRSYGEAREGMLAYAGWLSGAEGIQPGDRVAICLPKTLETVQLVYGILAAGAAYVPLQYQGPPARLNRILASIRPALLVTTRQMAAMIRSAGAAGLPAVRTVEVDHDEAALAALKQGIAPRESVAEVSPADLAAVFFTSGSTGEPKGAMLSQRSIGAAISIAHGDERLRGRPTDRRISMSGLHYAASCEIFYPVNSGASVYLCSDRETLPDHQAAVLERERTTIWESTATTLRLLLEGGQLQDRDLSALRIVWFFGERMPIATLRAAMDALPQAEFVNCFGASEAIVMTTYIVPRPLAADIGALPLGRPCPAYKVSLRDEAGRVVDAGEVGEICVVGPAVTIGYWDDPALSEAKRLPGIPDSYRTGDLAWQDAEGLIWSTGRKDHQVKLRGHRLDLGEIEAVARSAPGVREAVAFAPGADGVNGDVALAVLAEGTAEKRRDIERALRRICRERLPRFAWPRRIVLCGEFPLLSSGKIDRRALEAIVMQG